VASEAPASHHGALAGLDQVVATGFEAVDLRARGHKHRLVTAARSVLLLASPVTAAPGAEMPGAVKRGEVPLGGVADHHHVSSASSIPPVGTAPRHVSLAAKADATVAASPPFDVDLGAVVEHDDENNSAKSLGLRPTFSADQGASLTRQVHTQLPRLRR
jgi:hypothetical protein